MNHPNRLKTTIPSLLITLALLCFELLPGAQAVVPPPDGGYPGSNTAEGQNALFSLTTGGFNTAVGFLSLRSNTIGSFNTAVGAGTLLSSTGDQNTATGTGALLSNSTGHENTAIGAFTLFSNTTGFQNTANGLNALFNNTTGSGNVADGYLALFHNTTGGINTAIGWQALFNNTGGNGNTAIGDNVLFNNTSGSFNIASGDGALFYNTVGDGNIAIGYAALNSNTAGAGNTAIGDRALFNNAYGNFNIALGSSAGTNVTTAHSVICIGVNVGGANVSDTTWIGGVYGVHTQSGTTAPVVVSHEGQLGTVASSERFKKNISTMETASEAILALHPVTFHYKTDTTGTPQFGLIAEEVAKVNPVLVLPDKEGKPYTVRYEAVNAMLLNEFLKEHRKVEELKSDFQGTVAKQQKEIAALTATVKEQAAQIQKVSAQLEASKPAPQMVNNP